MRCLNRTSKWLAKKTKTKRSNDGVSVARMGLHSNLSGYLPRCPTVYIPVRDEREKQHQELTLRRCCISSSLYSSFSLEVLMYSLSVFTSLFLSSSFSLLIASSIISALGSPGMPIPALPIGPEVPADVMNARYPSLVSGEEERPTKGLSRTTELPPLALCRWPLVWMLDVLAPLVCEVGGAWTWANCSCSCW